MTFKGTRMDLGLGEFVPWRVFVNHIDGYHGKVLAEYLADEAAAAAAVGKGKYRPRIGAEGEEEKEEEEEEDGDAESLVFEPPKRYQVIGTLRKLGQPCPKKVTGIVSNPESRDSLLSELMKCGVVIYDITEDSAQVEEARWALEAIAKTLDKRKEDEEEEDGGGQRRFILISNVLTWAETKSLDPKDVNVPLSETDYRKRRAHANFVEHIRCERDVSLMRHRKLKSLVICSGVTYGHEEGVLHYLFKMCWENAAFLPILGDGENRIPLVHVRDLVRVVAGVVREWPSARYILAVEDGPVTQKTIVESISEAFGNGTARSVAAEEAFLLLPEMSQSVYDSMTIDLNVKSDYVAERLGEDGWQHLGRSFPANIHEIVREYKAARGLGPVRLIVLGPPASGKTRVARYLARHYQLPCIDVRDFVGEVKVAEGEEEEEEDDYGQDGDRPDDATLNRLIGERLESRECSNRGYIMDGYPETYAQAEGLFGLGAEEEGTAAASVKPELVIELEASEEFLIERIVGLSEREMRRRGYTEERVTRRLREHRERKRSGRAALQFFDELEVRTVVLPIEEDLCPDMIPTIRRCLEKIGKPRNYGHGGTAPGAEEEEEEEEEEMSEEEEEREEKAMEWITLMERLKGEEEERLCLLGEPPRHYLVEHVLPTVTRALLRVGELRPDDPLDFLAEYLFEENPEGKMFEPECSERMSSLLKLVDKFRDDVAHAEDTEGQGSKGSEGGEGGEECCARPFRRSPPSCKESESFGFKYG